MRKFLRWTFFLILGFAGFLTLAYFLAKKYEAPVRNYMVKEVNKRLQSDLHVGDINFSFLERFPSASLVMDSVWSNENDPSKAEQDTLFFFRKAYLNLSVFDLMKGNYKINEIETRDGFIRLRINNRGQDNYHIWEPKEDTNGFLLELNKVHLENAELRYDNQLRRQLYHINIYDLDFSGLFSEESYTMGIDGNAFVNDLSLKGTSYLKYRKIDVESDMDIITANDQYIFRKGNLLIDDVLAFSLSGELKGSQLDLQLSGKDLDIIKTLGLLPYDSRAIFEDYESDGVIAFDASLNGVFGKTENPRVKANFKLINASVSKKGSSIELQNLIGTGSFDNGDKRNMQSSKLVFDNLLGDLNGDPFRTYLSVENFTKPSIVADAQFNTDIANIKDFFDLKWMEDGTGELGLEAHIETIIQDPDTLLASDFLNAKASGEIYLKNAQITLMNDQRIYQVDSSEFAIDNNSLIIKKYAGRINDCEIELSGRAKNFLNYLFVDQSAIEVEGNVKAGDVNLQALFPTRPDEDNEEASIVLAFPKLATWNLDLEVDQFVNGKFVAENISGSLTMDSFKAEATGLDFLSQSGSVKGEAGIYRFAANQFGLKTDFVARSIDVKQMFEAFKNFDQAYITNEEIEGMADADIQFLGFCDSLFNMDMKSIVSSVNLKVKEGGLVGFDPVIELADYVKEKRMLRMFVSAEELKKRLENIQFATLTNEFSIREGMIRIPKMEIKSSAVDLNVSGSHSFNDEIDYAFDFALSELLALEDRKEPYNEYVQRDSDGRTRIFLSMKGTVDDFEVELLKTDIKRKAREEWNAEKSEVKSILKEEFGLYKSDTTIKVQRSQDMQEDLLIEFDAEQGTATSKKPDAQIKVPEPIKDSSTQGILNRIKKKSKSNKTKLEEGDFDDDDF